MAISEKLSGDTVAVRLGQPYRQSTLGAVGNFFDREDVLGYLLLVPVLVILGVFVGYPFVYGVWLAFTDTTIVHQGQFTGLDNLERTPRSAASVRPRPIRSSTRALPPFSSWCWAWRWPLFST